MKLILMLIYSEKIYNADINIYQKGNIPPDVSKKNVAVFDIAFPKETTLRLIEQSKRFILLDHHRSQMIDLKNVPYTFFDLKRSGAKLGWNFFHPGQPAPTFIDYIEEKDLWIWKTQESKPFAAQLESVPMNFIEYNKFLDQVNEFPDFLKKKNETSRSVHCNSPFFFYSKQKKYLENSIEKGKIIENYVNSMIEKSATRAVMKKFHGKNAYALNSSQWHSELGNYLAKQNGCDLALIWTYDLRDHAFYVSLRSESDDIDVSRLAKIYGGGGHPKASGFRYKGNIEKIFDKEN